MIIHKGVHYININCNSNENPFTQRVKNEINSTYHPTMRRFIQTIALYEADRCLQDRYQALRPFQRKIALYDVCVDLIETLQFIPDSRRSAIMYRTARGLLLTPELVSCSRSTELNCPLWANFILSHLDVFDCIQGMEEDETNWQGYWKIHYTRVDATIESK